MQVGHIDANGAYRLDGSKLGGRSISFVSTGATLLDGSLIVVWSVEDSWLFVWAFGNETGHDVLPTQVIGRELGEVEDSVMVWALACCYGGCGSGLTFVR